MKNVAQYLIARLRHLGVDTCFSVTGGAAMFLNDAAAQGMHTVYMHHEQAAAMAAEAYGRLSGKPALLCVTAGPGGINALNGVFGAYTDSVPMIVLSGQVKCATLRACVGDNVTAMRQLGDQEVDIIAMATPITKAVRLLHNPADAKQVIDEMFVTACEGRHGPVWIDIPIDVQGARAPEFADVTALCRHPCRFPPTHHDIAHVVHVLRNAQRPVVLAGGGIHAADATDYLCAAIEAWGIPVATAWTIDVISSTHPLFVGRAGTIGTRAGNAAVQNADVVLAVGTSLNIRQISYNIGSFARKAYKIRVDIDLNVFASPLVNIDYNIHADAGLFLQTLTEAAPASVPAAYVNWQRTCADYKRTLTPCVSHYTSLPHLINPYHFMHALFAQLQPDNVVVCANAAATIVPFQIGLVPDGVRVISNSGSASMGYDLPAALGAAIARPKSRIICLAGDGSIMMNVQELQTLAHLQADVTVFVLNNGGYLSIRQTQQHFFGRETGTSAANGVSFPDFCALGAVFLGNERVRRFSNPQTIADDLRTLRTYTGPQLVEVMLDPQQGFSPRLKSRRENGIIVTPELDEMC